VTPFPRPLAGYTAVLFGAAVLGALAVSFDAKGSDLVALAILGSLVVFSTHRSVTLPNGAFVSPALMVCVAGIVLSAHDGWIALVFLLGILSGFNWRSVSRKGWGWIPFNAGVSALALAAARAAFVAVPTSISARMPSALIAVGALAAVYVAVAWSLVALSYVVETRHFSREAFGGLGPLILEVMPFAVLGFLLGRLYLALSPAVMLLIIVPILIAREMFASYMRVKESHDETVQLLIRALEQKDPYTAGHAERVAVYAGYIGAELEFMPVRLERLRFAALMHDIGKLVVPNHLLNKPGKLTEDEFARVRIHEGVSVQMLSHIDFLRPIALHAHSDAMKFDPDDLDHPIEPYVIMVADAYDAMTSTRSYRKALPQDVAFEELRNKAGTQFHPACAEALIRAIQKRNEVHGKGHEEDSHFENAPEVGLGSAGLGDLLPDEKAKQ